MVSAYNVHLPVQMDARLTTGFLGEVRRRTMARDQQYRGLLRDVAGNPSPVLVAGDFNTSPSMGDLRGLRARLVDAVRANPSLYPVTWPANTWLRLWRLDWVFTTRDVQVYRYDFTDPHGMSDHRVQRLLVSPG